MKPGRHSFSSARTALAPFAARDAEELHVLFRDPAVRRYLLDGSLVSMEWVRGEISASDARFEEGAAGLWSIRLGTDTPIVGFAGFREFFDPPRLQLLYGLLPGHWGCGLATEAASEVCGYAFRELGFSEVRAAIDIPNEASGRVLERLGMRQERTTPDGDAGTASYVLDRSTWSARLECEQRATRRKGSV